MKFPNFLRVAVLPLRHLTEISYHEDGSIFFTGGVEANFIQVLSQLLGFHYQLITPEDGEWGQKTSDGNWTGIVGLVHRNNADIAIGHLTITPERLAAADFLPYGVEENSFATKRPRFLPRVSFYTLPFDNLVWILILCTILIMPFLFKVLLHMKKAFRKLFLKMLGIILGQQTNIEPKRSKDRILMGVWIFFAFIIASSYRSVLLSCMTVPLYELDIRTIKDLADALREGRYTASYGEGSVDRELLMQSLDESLREIGKYIVPQNWLIDNNIVVAPTNISNYHAVFGPRFFFLLEYGEEPYTSKRIFKETISFWNVGLAVRKQFCCKKQLTKQIAMIINTGIYEKIYQEELFKTRINFNWKEVEHSKITALSMSDLLGVFVLLGAGYCIALFGFLLEKSKIIAEHFFANLNDHKSG
ncbi:glutamate receptor ionotropic, delta-2-like [Argiope bruennichi]|uniref:glutamate receptor ionotropic, delta-2-like n=1 Tax=Argiope bruennichi TaxID=94029 RepID=UPI002494E554|nr:glutamate receptor ionotropic, delta-2-like [Argiope bruennichi]